MPLLQDITPHAHLLAETGRGLYDRGEPAELRLALVVLDGLAETLLRFNSDEQEVWLQIGRTAARIIAENGEDGTELPFELYELTFPISTTFADLSEGTYVHLSRTQRKKLYEFDSNVDMAVFFGTISTEDGMVLKALHHYRNRAYHHNHAHGGTLASLVQLQLTVLARVARSIRPQVGVPITSSHGSRLPSLADIAHALDAGVQLDVSRLIESLKEALTAQLRVLDAEVAEVESFINSGLPLVTTDDVIRLVQMSEPWPDVAAARQAQVRVPPELVARWRTEVSGVGADGDPSVAVAEYFGIEKQLTRLLEDVRPVADEVDRAIDNMISERRVNIVATTGCPSRAVLEQHGHKPGSHVVLWGSGRLGCANTGFPPD